MKTTFLFTILFLTLNTLTFGQSSRWITQIDSANIFSSPRFSDLNKDGFLDVIIGGGIESVSVGNGVLAINGKTGETLWSVASKSQIYTSALFQDINGDQIQDVFIGGREAIFYAIDGSTGNIIWEFWPPYKGDARKAGILNFFATQWIEDQNKDGFKDLLVTNGGDYLAGPKQKDRPAAQLMVLDGKTGNILAKAKMPEKRESYYAPHVYANSERKESIIFGTGGETVNGGLWEVPLTDLMKNSISKAKLIVRDSTSGFILNSVLADINGDGFLDIMNARMNATLTAIDGVNHEVLWKHSFSGYECYVTPSLGQLVGDETPDFFTILAEGTFPMYTDFKLVVIDGKTGELVWEENSGFNQFSPAALLDLNFDGTDEIVYIENKILDQQKFIVINQIRVIDLKNTKSFYIGSVRNGLSMAAAPSIIDINNDGFYELVVATSAIPEDKKLPYSLIECIDLKQELESISWPGYLGPNENGTYIVK